MLMETASDAATQTLVAETLAPAKINLTLQVVGPRADGFHEIRSLVAGIELSDRIRLEQSGREGVECVCSEPALEGPDNLACRAARELAVARGIRPSIRIHLQKRIPVGTGLGGGSSDAAAALNLCRAHWDLHLDDEELAAIGASVGSDIPLFMHLPSSVITGRGENVCPMRLQWSGWVLLVFAGPAVSTAAVYRSFLMTDRPLVNPCLEEAVCRLRSADEIMALSCNHLESAIFRVAPKVADVFDQLNRVGLGPARVSGAGSAIYRLFDGFQEADRIARRVRKLGIGAKTEVVAVPAGPPRIF